jgi:hypothetical protein
VEGLGPVAAAAAAFVGTHFLLSHSLRKPIVDTVGSAAFLGIYSLLRRRRSDGSRWPILRHLRVRYCGRSAMAYGRRRRS